MNFINGDILLCNKRYSQPDAKKKAELAKQSPTQAERKEKA